MSKTIIDRNNVEISHFVLPMCTEDDIDKLKIEEGTLYFNKSKNSLLLGTGHNKYNDISNNEETYTPPVVEEDEFQKAYNEKFILRIMMVGCITSPPDLFSCQLQKINNIVRYTFHPNYINQSFNIKEKDSNVIILGTIFTDIYRPFSNIIVPFYCFINNEYITLPMEINNIGTCTIHYGFKLSDNITFSTCVNGSFLARK